MLSALLCAALLAVQPVPILMYHDFVPGEPENVWQVSAERFEEHLSALEVGGYSAVTLEALSDYAHGEAELPEKCVVLTCDDGYSGVTEIAAPLCERYGMTISCAVIGSKAGMPGHFDLAESLPDSLELFSHGFDLHRMTEGLPVLSSAENLRALLGEDTASMNERYGHDFPMIRRAFAYPYGSFTPESDGILGELGVELTLTCRSGCACPIRGEPSSLFGLPRYLVEETMTGDGLLRLLDRAYEETAASFVNHHTE